MALSKPAQAQQKAQSGQAKRKTQSGQTQRKTQSGQAQRKAQSVKTVAKPAQARKQAQSGQLQRKAQNVKPVTKPKQVPKQGPVAKPAQVPTRTRQETRQDLLQKAQKLRFDRQNHNLQLKMKRNMINENMIKAKAKRGSSAGFWVMVVLIVLGGLGSLMYFIVAPFLGWITNPIGSLTSMFNPKKWF